MVRRLILLILLLLVLTTGVSAQDPLILNQLLIAEITTGDSAPAFPFTATAGQTVQIEVVEVTAGLAPQFTITNSNGVFVQGTGNPAQESRVTGVVTFQQGGEYFIGVSSVSEVTGQFVIRLSETAPTLPATALLISQPVNGTLSAGQQQHYSIMADASTQLVLAVEGSVGITLQNAAGEVAAAISSSLNGGALYLPPGTQTYQLQLVNESATTPVAYSLALNPRGAAVPTTAPTTTPEAGATEVTLPALASTGACVLATLRAEFVNVRSGANIGLERVASLDPQRTYSVVGRTSDSTWYEIDYGGGRGWVADFVTRRGGDCSNVPVTDLPPTATPQIAGDNEWLGVELPFEPGFFTGNFGAISYPEGDRQDTITYQITNVPESIPPGVQLIYSFTCTGDFEHAVVRFLDGTTAQCVPLDQQIIRTLRDTSARSGGFTIMMTGGDQAYVEWRVEFRWVFP
jgi:uncharacterized protein YraI